MKLIDKDALMAEIEREKSELGNTFSDKWACGFLDNILRFIDTLEVKDVDLEEETKKWWKERLHLNPKNQLWMDAHQSVELAKHFFELGISVSNKAQKGE